MLSRPEVERITKTVLDEVGSRLDRFWWRVFVGLLILQGVLTAYSMSPWHRDDDTERPGWASPSGLTPHVDHKTGCEYLSHDGALIPRVAADGRTHLGCRNSQR